MSEFTPEIDQFILNNLELHYGRVRFKNEQTPPKGRYITIMNTRFIQAYVNERLKVLRLREKITSSPSYLATSSPSHPAPKQPSQVVNINELK